MPIKTIEPRRLYRQIVDQLRSLIVSGEFAIGSRLPPERDLAKQLGVSRPSLREALIALEVTGYIEVRTGSGIFVCEPTSPVAPALDDEVGPLELIRARALIEGEIVATAAKTGRQNDFSAVEEALKKMEADARAGIKPLDADRLFHIRIAEITGNSLLAGLVKQLFDYRMGPLFGQLQRHFDTPDVWAQAIAEHRQILVALRKKNPPQARAAMRHHMDMAFERYTASVAHATEHTRTPSRAFRRPGKVNKSPIAALRKRAR